MGGRQTVYSDRAGVRQRGRATGNRRRISFDLDALSHGQKLGMGGRRQGLWMDEINKKTDSMSLVEVRCRLAER